MFDTEVNKSEDKAYFIFELKIFIWFSNKSQSRVIETNYKNMSKKLSMVHKNYKWILHIKINMA